MTTVAATPAVEETPAIAPEAEQQDSQGDLIGGKFKSQEDLPAAYQELERKTADTGGDNNADSGAGGTDEGSEEEEPEVGSTESPYEPAITEALTGAGLDPNSVAQEWQENGSLSDATYSALEAKGHKRELVDAVVKVLSDNQQLTQQSTAQQEAAQVQELQEIVGGEEGFKEMSNWMRDNLPREEIEAYNKIASGNDYAATKFALESMKARMEASQGKRPNLMQGGQQPKTDVFRSAAEMQSAMKDPRYRKDPAYTRQVEEKAMRSSVFNSTVR